MKEKIQLNDFLNYTFLSNLQYSNDEKNCAFVASVANEEENTYESCLQLYDGKNAKALTSYGKENLYIWEDNEHILFANMRQEKDRNELQKGSEKTCFYRIGIHGGEAVLAFTIPMNVTSIKKIDQNQYAFTAQYNLQYPNQYSSKEDVKQSAIKEKQAMKDYEILDEFPFYGNGAGFQNKIRNSLFLYDSSEETSTRISELYLDVADFELDEKKKMLVYTGESYTQCSIHKEGIFVYSITEKTTETILEAKEYTVYKAMPWLDKLLVVASDQKRYGLNENPSFYLLDATTKEMKLFVNYEDSLGSSVGSDCRYGGGYFLQVYEDHVYFLATIVNRSSIFKLSKDGTIEVVYDVEGSVDDFALAKGKLLFCGMQDLKLQELYLCDIHGNHRCQITSYNEEILRKKDVRPCVPCNFKQEDLTLYGWVLEPKEYDPKKSYPAILDIHGGPKTVYGEVFYHEMQVWANMGYFVFFMNPRGGDGRGNEFADLRGKYGTIDYDDIMKFCDVVCEKYPAIDKKRVGVTGGSYGGFMTNWMIGHTHRFACAASQRSIANWISFSYTSDIGGAFGSDQQGGSIWEDHDTLWEHSPLKYAKKVKTPTLFIHSDEDYRCPISEGYQMYGALCEQGIETRMCLFHGENHELSRSGKPKHRVKRLEEITNWMEAHLK